MGVGLGEQVDPRNLIVVPALGCGEDKAKEVFAVDEPASPKNVKHIKDARVNERCNPALFHRPYATRRRHTGRLGRGRALPVDSLAN